MPVLIRIAAGAIQTQAMPDRNPTRCSLTVLVVAIEMTIGCAPQRIVPTDADRQLVERVESAAVTMRDTPARELFNHYADHPPAQRWRNAILGRQPMDASELDRARHYLQRRLDIADLMERWPAPEPIAATRTDAPLIIDGVLDEADWQRGRPVDVAYPPNQLDAEQPAVATARVLWDPTHLYVGFDVRDRSIVAPRLDRDGETYLYDCVEVFVLTDRTTGTFWEFNVSPRGDIYDAWCVYLPDRWRNDRQVERNVGNLDVGCRINADGYVVEIAVPRDRLRDSDGARADRLWVLLATSDVRSVSGRRAQTYYAHVPTIATFHNIDCYSPLELVE